MGQTEARKRPITQSTGRMLGSGVDPADFTKMVARTDAGEDWVEVCEELGDAALALAEAAIQEGHLVTARRFYLNAQACYRVGQYGIIEFTDEKLRLYGKLLDSFAKAARLYEPPLQQVSIPYKGYQMDGWLWLPGTLPRIAPWCCISPELPVSKKRSTSPAVRWCRGAWRFSTWTALVRARP